MSTSFVRKAPGRPNRLPVIPGTKPSLRTSQLLTSSGHLSLDAILGGGIPVGSLLLIEEDYYGIVADVVLRYYLAEGVHCCQPTVIVTDGGAGDKDRILSNIPPVSKSKEDAAVDAASQNAEMTIAWRYENLATVSPSVDSEAGKASENRSYNLSKSVDRAVIDSLDISVIDINETQASSEENYSKLFAKLASKVTEEQFRALSDRGPVKPALLRLCIRGLGSPLWTAATSGAEASDQTNVPSDNTELLQFLYGLKCLVRHNYAVGLISISPQFFTASLRRRLRHMCGAVLELTSFQDAPGPLNPLYADYEGLVKVIQLSTMNSLCPFIPESTEYGYIIKTRRLQIDRLHLPPDLTETTSRTSQLGMGSCAVGLKKANLDF